MVVTWAVSANGLIIFHLDKTGKCFLADIDKLIEITELLCIVSLCFNFINQSFIFCSLNGNVQKLALFEQNINKSY